MSVAAPRRWKKRSSLARCLWADVLRVGDVGVLVLSSGGGVLGGVGKFCSLLCTSDAGIGIERDDEDLPA